MQVLVYDTHVHTAGGYYHFDVLVSEQTKAGVTDYAAAYLKSIGVGQGQIRQQRCDFCHAELANPAVRATISERGYAIIPMQGCPATD
ncbi:DUF2024 family protein [Bowmanella dokdonensis]|uniref:DUF2024 family protein n=1 Tax=Bowmanella dokdonensis TaxID=751969 RepID=A0A939DNJ2_9ALTE|nr:DUF2024 family protein [Bowmanella dokdonensis]MBN7825788.1 DUF2024 family protein [Bowmanella dokdonensis]